MIPFGPLTILSELTLRVKQNLELSYSVNFTKLIKRRRAAIPPSSVVPLRALPGAPSSRTCPTCPKHSRRELSRREPSRREPVRGSAGGSLLRVAQALLPVRLEWSIPAQPRVPVLPDFAPRALRLFCPCCLTLI